jgi:hypothetical protein
VVKGEADGSASRVILLQKEFRVRLREWKAPSYEALFGPQTQEGWAGRKTRKRREAEAGSMTSQEHGAPFL